MVQVPLMDCFVLRWTRGVEEEHAVAKRLQSQVRKHETSLHKLPVYLQMTSLKRSVSLETTASCSQIHDEIIQGFKHAEERWPGSVLPGLKTETQNLNVWL